MIELTEQQRRELNADPPRVIDPQTKKTYILVSEEAYERMQALLHAAGLRAGWDDPEMEIYDREEKERDNP